MESLLTGKRVRQDNILSDKSDCLKRVRVAKKQERLTPHQVRLPKQLWLARVTPPYYSVRLWCTGHASTPYIVQRLDADV